MTQERAFQGLVAGGAQGRAQERRRVGGRGGGGDGLQQGARIRQGLARRGRRGLAPPLRPRASAPRPCRGRSGRGARSGAQAQRRPASQRHLGINGRQGRARQAARHAPARAGPGAGAPRPRDAPPCTAAPGHRRRCCGAARRYAPKQVTSWSPPPTQVRAEGGRAEARADAHAPAPPGGGWPAARHVGRAGEPKARGGGRGGRRRRQAEPRADPGPGLHPCTPCTPAPPSAPLQPCSPCAAALNHGAPSSSAAAHPLPKSLSPTRHSSAGYPPPVHRRGSAGAQQALATAGGGPTSPWRRRCCSLAAATCMPRSRRSERWGAQARRRRAEGRREGPRS